jgi:hypothetical protein
MQRNYILGHVLVMLVLEEWKMDFMMFVFPLALRKPPRIEFGVPAKNPQMNCPNQPWENGVNMATVRDIVQLRLN